MSIQTIAQKIQTISDAEKTISHWRSAGDTIVFTNGCFDLLHYGHIQYLADARSLGQRLVVGLNSSQSVSDLKGPHRPINDEKTRSFVLAALEMVDLVVVFNDPTPIQLIETFSPDFLVKGGDWQAHQIVGSTWVLNNGGQVKSLPFADGYSTTNLEQKIISNFLNPNNKPPLQ